MSNRKFTEKLWNESRNSIYKHHPEITPFIFMSNRKFTEKLLHVPSTITPAYPVLVGQLQAQRLP